MDILPHISFAVRFLLIALGIVSLGGIITSILSNRFAATRNYNQAWGDVNGYYSFYSGANTVFKDDSTFASFTSSKKADSYYYPLSFFRLISGLFPSFTNYGLLLGSFICPIICLLLSVIWVLICLADTNIHTFDSNLLIAIAGLNLYFCLLPKDLATSLSARICVPVAITFSSIGVILFLQSGVDIYSTTILIALESVFLIGSVYFSQFAFQCLFILLIVKSIILSHAFLIPIAIFVFVCCVYDKYRKKIYSQFLYSLKLSRRIYIKNPLAFSLSHLFISMGIIHPSDRSFWSSTNFKAIDLKFSILYSFNILPIAICCFYFYYHPYVLIENVLASPAITTLSAILSLCLLVGSLAVTVFILRGFGPPFRYLESFIPFVDFTVIYILSSINLTNKIISDFLLGSILLVQLVKALIVSRPTFLQALKKPESSTFSITDRLKQIDRLTYIIRKYLKNYESINQFKLDSKSYVNIFPSGSDFGDNLFVNAYGIPQCRVWSALSVNPRTNYISCLDDTSPDYGQRVVLDFSKLEYKPGDLFILDRSFKHPYVKLIPNFKLIAKNAEFLIFSMR